MSICQSLTSFRRGIVRNPCHTGKHAQHTQNLFTLSSASYLIVQWFKHFRFIFFTKWDQLDCILGILSTSDQLLTLDNKKLLYSHPSTKTSFCLQIFKDYFPNLYSASNKTKKKLKTRSLIQVTTLHFPQQICTQNIYAWIHQLTTA